MGDQGPNLTVRWVGANKFWRITVYKDTQVLQWVTLRCGQTEAWEAGRVLLKLWQLREGGE